MYKNFFAICLLCGFIVLPVYAEDAVFSNSDTEQFNLQPLNDTSNASSVSKPAGNVLSEENFVNAVNNLDNAQVEIRDQLSSYSALMLQSKTNYETKKDEYKNYKKEYKSLKKKLKNVEKSKKLIQGNMTSVQNTAN